MILVVMVVIEDSFLFRFIGNKLKLMIRMVVTPKGFCKGTVSGLGIECCGVDVEEKEGYEEEEGDCAADADSHSRSSAL